MGQNKKLIREGKRKKREGQTIEQALKRSWYETLVVPFDVVPYDEGIQHHNEYIEGKRKFPKYRLRTFFKITADFDVVPEQFWLVYLTKAQARKFRKEHSIPAPHTAPAPVTPRKARPLVNLMDVQCGERKQFNLAAEIAAVRPTVLRKAESKARKGDKDTILTLEHLALVAIYKAAPSFKGKSTFSTWAISVVENTMNSFFNRRERRWKRYIPSGGMDVQAIDGEHGGQLENRVVRATSNAHRDNEAWEAEVEAEEQLLSAIMRAAELVPHGQLVLERYLEGVSYQQMASRLGITEESVRQRVSRAARMIERVTRGM